MQAKYPQKPLLSEITDHQQLPAQAVELAGIYNKLNYGELLLFLKMGETLVIVDASGPDINGDKHYILGQFEAPLGFLPWFADALNDFQKPPAEGGLHAGAMSSADQEVEGEMLCIQRAMDAGNHQGGYAVLNRSRPDRFRLDRNSYGASEIIFANNFLACWR